MPQYHVTSVVLPILQVWRLTTLWGSCHAFYYCTHSGRDKAGGYSFYESIRRT